jgi:hypothetical protein
MRLPLEVSRLARETMHEVLQFVQIRVKRDGLRDFCLLVQLGRGFESLGPRHGSPQRRPLQENAGIRNGHWARSFQAHVQPESVRQMADHLVRGYFSPAPRTRGTNRLQPGNDFSRIFRMEQSLHARSSGPVAHSYHRFARPDNTLLSLTVSLPVLLCFRESMPATQTTVRRRGAL